MVKVTTDLNNLRTKIDDFDVVKLKTVPLDLKKLSDVVEKISEVISKEVAKNTKFNALNTKVNELKRIPVAPTLIQANQCNTDKQNIEKKIKDVEKIYQALVI